MACPTVGAAGLRMSRWDEPDGFAGWPPRKPRGRDAAPEGGSVLSRTVRLLRGVLGPSAGPADKGLEPELKRR
jgi:hypothetical protein